MRVLALLAAGFAIATTLPRAETGQQGVQHIEKRLDSPAYVPLEPLPETALDNSTNIPAKPLPAIVNGTLGQDAQTADNYLVGYPPTHVGLIMLITSRRSKCATTKTTTPARATSSSATRIGWAGASSP